MDRSVAQGRRTSPSDLLPAIAVAVVAFAAARLALLPGVAFWDTGEFQTVGPIMGTAHPTGYPTYVLLGWLASVVLQPLGEPAFRMNLLSALCLAVAVGITVDLVRSLTGSVALGVMAGLGLALTPIAWSIGTHADAHALHLALLAALLRLLVAWEDRVRGRRADDGHADRFLVAATVVFGLSVGNHSLTLLLAIPVGLYVLAVAPDVWRRLRLVVTCIGVLALTLVIVYLELPLRAGPFRAALVYGRPETWDGFWYVVLAEQFRGGLLDPFGDLAGKAGRLGSLAVSQFGLLAPLIPLGLVATVMRRPRYALLTGSAVAITCFFAASYVNADISRYYLGPILIAWTWLAILAGMVAEGAAASLGVGPAGAAGDPAHGGSVGMALPSALIAVLLLTPTLLVLPSRLTSVDASRDRIAAAWLDRVLPLLEPDAMVISWWSYSTPLWYAQKVEGRRPDIFIADDRTRLDQDLGELSDVIDDNLGRRPVYVLRQTPREIDALARRYELEYLTPQEAGLLVRVIGPRTVDMTRVERLTYFFPAHDEAGNIEGLVAEALETLPSLAERFEIIAVDDGSGDDTGRLADELAAGTRSSCGSSTTRPTWATVQPSDRASPPRATTSSRSPTAIASSRSPTSGGSRPARSNRTRPMSWSGSGSSGRMRSSGPPTRGPFGSPIAPSSICG